MGWSVGFVLVGWMVFRPAQMRPKDKKRSGAASPREADSANADDHRCNSFWYSLDLFAPAIDLHVADGWMPKLPEKPFPDPSSWRQRLLWHCRRWRWYYMHIHKCIGWILVPLGLAAVLGIVK